MAAALHGVQSFWLSSDVRIESILIPNQPPFRESIDSLFGLDARPECPHHPPALPPNEKETLMKRHVLQLNPILVPAINDKLESLYHMHRLFEQEDKEAYIERHGAVIEGVITGGHTGISNALMDRLPALKVVAVNGVGTDAVDLNHARSKGLPVTGTFGALTEDVADLALG
jgi:hypothetical protein